VGICPHPTTPLGWQLSWLAVVQAVIVPGGSCPVAVVRMAVVQVVVVRIPVQACGKLSWTRYNYCAWTLCDCWGWTLNASYEKLCQKDDGKSCNQVVSVKDQKSDNVLYKYILYICCSPSRIQASVLCFHDFGMIRNCTYLYSSN